MGHVVQAGSGQAPCRQAVIKAGLPKSIPCTTINKVCGSGMQSVISAIQSIKAGDNQICLAGGMESMSMAPHLLPGSRGGFKYGDTKLQDSLQVDGLWDVYNDQAMGVCAEKCVEKYSFSREELDEVAIDSFRRSQKAQDDNVFEKEIAPLEIQSRKKVITVSEDEALKKLSLKKSQH